MEVKMKQISRRAYLIKGLLFLALAAGCFYIGHAFAAPNTNTSLGQIASNITTSFKAIGQLILATAYLAGLAFFVAAIFKFKQHKDNPTQIPLGTPLALLGISAALVFLPMFIGPLGKTMFGSGDLQAGGFKGGGVSAVPGENQ